MSKNSTSVRTFLVREIKGYCGRLPENFNSIKAVTKIMLITFGSNQIFKKNIFGLVFSKINFFSSLNTELNPSAVLSEAHHILLFSRIRANVLLIYSPLLPENQ